MRNSVHAALLAGAASAFTIHAPGDVLAPGGTSAELTLDDGYVEGLSRPTAFAFLPDGRMVITEQAGTLRIRSAAGALVSAGRFPVAQGSPEQGLLNVLPHPAFAQNRLLFVYYTAGAGATPPPDEYFGNRLVTIELGEDDQLRAGSERVLIDGIGTLGNHNGGALAVLRDRLFVGVGDATGPLRANCLTSANGKILRIDLDGSIPADNPLVGRDVEECDGGTEARTEIWTWGLRNPWRIWADARTGKLWVGDVGDGAREEIDVVPETGAVHFGWPHREGDMAFPGEVTACADDPAGGGNCREPVHVCEHPTCQSITGGLILDGCEWPASLEGRYVFGDFESRWIWTLGVNAARDDVIGERVPLAQAEASGPVHFVEHQGALYALMHAGTGHVTRIAPRTPDAACTGSGGSAGGGSGGNAGRGASTAGSGAAPGEGGDASGGTSSAGAPRGGSSSSAAGGENGGGPSNRGGAAGEDSARDSSGCGCRLAGKSHGALLAILVASSIAFAARRRR